MLFHAGKAALGVTAVASLPKLLLAGEQTGQNYYGSCQKEGLLGAWPYCYAPTWPNLSAAIANNHSAWHLLQLQSNP